MKKFSRRIDELDSLLEELGNKYNMKPEEINYKIGGMDGDKVIFNILNLKENIPQGKDDLEDTTTKKKFPIKILSDDEKMELEISKKGIFLVVDDTSKSMNNVIDFVIEEGIKSPAMEKLTYAYENRQKRVRIADFFEDVYTIPEITIEISKDEYSASIFLSRRGLVQLLTESKIKEELKKKGIKYGIKEDVIKDILKENRKAEIITIAQGEELIDGKDAYIEYKVDIKPKENRAPKVLKDGSVDFKELNIIEKVKKDQVLAVKHPPRKGETGIKVTGEKFKPKEGKDIKLKGGENTRLSEDGNTLISEVDGMASFDNQKLEISDIFVIDEIGVESGNINFGGNVLVNQNVKPGYSVYASKNIKVLGNVEKAYLTAGGNIQINESFFGKNHGKLEAVNDIIVSFVESATLEAKNNLIINKGIMNCEVLVTGKVIALSYKGKIIGGHISAGGGIDTMELGNPSGTPTYVEVGINPNIVKEEKKLAQEYMDMSKKLSQIEKNLEFLEKLKREKELYKISNEKKEKLEKLYQAKFSMTLYLKEVSEKIGNIKKSKKKAEHAYVKVKEVCYSGVIIKIQDAIYKVKDDLEHVKFYEDNGVVKYTSYS